MKARGSGFTLVELSIVLVIVGLLIGGLLSAQSMIATSKIVAVTAQIGQFDAGVENFKTKYNYLPGDAPAFGGNGDGLLTNWDPTYQSMQVNTNAYEIANFWNNWNSQEYAITANNPHGVKAIINGLGKNVPLSKVGSTNSFFIVSALSNTGTVSANTSNPKNYYTILAGSQIQTPWSGSELGVVTTTSTNSAIKPSDLLALDKKIDDGIANTGDVLSGNINNSNSGINGGLDIVPNATCNNVTTHAYQVQDNSYGCTPLIRIGAQAGDPQ